MSNFKEVEDWAEWYLAETRGMSEDFPTITSIRYRQGTSYIKLSHDYGSLRIELSNPRAKELLGLILPGATIETTSSKEEVIGYNGRIITALYDNGVAMNLGEVRNIEWRTSENDILHGKGKREYTIYKTNLGMYNVGYIIKEDFVYLDTFERLDHAKIKAEAYDL